MLLNYIRPHLKKHNNELAIYCVELIALLIHYSSNSHAFLDGLPDEIVAYGDYIVAYGD